jgi:3-phenylpropionate/trans-cinnamate dioxygenase ferredoxin reductase subunit
VTAGDSVFVIVGAGHAGGRAAEAMRQLGFAGPIVLIGAEPHLPYERPPLSKELLQAEGGGGFTLIRDRAWYDEQGIDCRLGGGATAIDPETKTVHLADGSTIAYGKLLLAPGISMRRLAVPGGELANVCYLRTIDDSRAIEAQLEPGRNVVVVGGGFIGLEVAASARKRGCAVTVIEATDRLMGRGAVPAVSEAFLALHRDNGVAVRLGASVDRFEGETKVERVVLSDGSDLFAELVVVGIGVIPETGLAEVAGLEVDNGILVDEHCRTSVRDIYAAGDATNHFSPQYERHIRLESWENAQNQAIAAARNMCGEDFVYSGIPWMWSDQYDAGLQVAGVPTEWDAIVYRGDPASRDFIAFQLSDAQIVGAQAVNRPRDMRFARRLMSGGRAVDQKALADEGTPLRDLAR